MDRFIEKHRAGGRLVIQPRMGVPDLSRMREYLGQIKATQLPVIGTITIDSYTRLNQLEEVARKLKNGEPLNGFPICTYSTTQNDSMLAGLLDEHFPIQVRHGSPQPQHIFRAQIGSGLYYGEGGPVSYCLPYSRIPLADSVDAWRKSCELFQQHEAARHQGHLESFGGCMLGQLCPPAILIALSVLECMFFCAHGIQSVSVSYAQGCNSKQDIGALLALRLLAQRFLSKVRWHVVLYTFMGMFPRTRKGARKLIEESVHVATAGQAERLIVKTAVEAFKIPTPSDNLDALHWAAAANNLFRLQSHPICARIAEYRDRIHEQSLKIIERALNIASDIGASICAMFSHGFLDIPYCIHKDNAGRARTMMSDSGEVVWVSVGNMDYVFERESPREVKASDLLRGLSFAQMRFDASARRSAWRRHMPLQELHAR